MSSLSLDGLSQWLFQEDVGPSCPSPAPICPHQEIPIFVQPSSSRTQRGETSGRSFIPN